MGGTGVIDHFLEVFTRYIDSGFGLLGGEVAFIATTLIVIDMTLAALFWSWGADEDIIARLVKKTLFVGVFAYIIGNWNALAKIVFESFAGLGLKASGTGFSAADLLRPGRVAQVGLDAGRPILEFISGLMGYIAFFENFIQITVLLFAWVMVLLAFFILAIQLFVTLIEFKLTTLAGFVLIPFGLFGKTAFLAERVLGNVVSSGVKVLVLAVIVGIGSTLFAEFTRGFGGKQPSDRGCDGDRARRAFAARPRHLRARHRQRPRLRRAAAWRGRRRRHRPRRRWRGRGGRRRRRHGREGSGHGTRRDRRRGARRRGHRRRRGDLLRDRVSRTERHGRRRIGSRRCRARRRWCSRAIGEARGRARPARRWPSSYRGGARTAVAATGGTSTMGTLGGTAASEAAPRHVLATRMGAAHEAPRRP